MSGPNSNFGGTPRSRPPVNIYILNAASDNGFSITPSNGPMGGVTVSPIKPTAMESTPLPTPNVQITPLFETPIKRSKSNYSTLQDSLKLSSSLSSLSSQRTSGPIFEPPSDSKFTGEIKRQLKSPMKQRKFSSPSRLKSPIIKREPSSTRKISGGVSKGPTKTPCRKESPWRKYKLPISFLNGSKVYEFIKIYNIKYPLKGLDGDFDIGPIDEGKGLGDNSAYEKYRAIYVFDDILSIVFHCIYSSSTSVRSDLLLKLIYELDNMSFKPERPNFHWHFHALYNRGEHMFKSGTKFNFKPELGPSGSELKKIVDEATFNMEALESEWKDLKLNHETTGSSEKIISKDDFIMKYICIFWIKQMKSAADYELKCISPQSKEFLTDAMIFMINSKISEIISTSC